MAAEASFGAIAASAQSLIAPSGFCGKVDNTLWKPGFKRLRQRSSLDRRSLSKQSRFLRSL
jgi:hypothetical protein